MIVDIVEALAALQDHTTAQILIPNLAKLTHGVLGDLRKRRLALASDRDHILTELQRECFRLLNILPARANPHRQGVN